MELFNDGWQFAKTKPEGFTPVAIPHDWLIADSLNLYETGVGWYQKKLAPGFLANRLTKGQRFLLRFDGVYMDSTLYVNGAQAGEWKYGYTAFEFDITDFLDVNGENTLLLKVNYQSPNSRWYSGAGIYRDVFIKVKNAAHFVSDGIYVTPRRLTDGRWQVEADAEVETGGRPCEIRHTLPGADGDLIISKPRLWDIESPALYTLQSELVVDGQVVDTEETRFGLRETAFTPNDGFLLNGRRVKLQGVCLHHDLGALGAAVHPDAIRRQLLLLRSMGVNAIRTSHNPPASAFMKLTDEMGFLVMSELLDMWKRPKTEYDYARFFDQWVERDAAAWVRRDRNCPSVIMWSVGNEIYDTHADAADGGETLQRLISLVKRHDPKGHAPATLCSNYMAWENTQKCADIIKLIGYNYAEYLCEAHHKAHPDWVIYGSETGSTVQSRGVYHFPLSRSVLADDDLQCSSLGNSSTSWGAKNLEACLVADRDLAFSLGQFLWAGIDYIGEPTPYHTKNCYFGYIDTAGFPKDSFYVIQSAWTSAESTPMVHIFPYWDFSPGQPVDVRVCSNAPRVELFLNGKSLGTFDIDHQNGAKLVGDWTVPYEKGELKALAYDKNGHVIAQAVRHSFGDAERLAVQEERIGALIFCQITALDKDGYTVENTNSRVLLTVEGGQLLGTDNGDSTDYDSYQSNSRRMFGGRLLAIVRPDAGQTVRLTAALDTADIPVRKIELIADGCNVTARTYPANATCGELCWRLTDSGGINSPLGTIEAAADGRGVLVRPKGDGAAYVRCGVKNGKDHLDLYTQIPITFTGFGKLFLNPYEFVSGGLYNRSNVELTNGNEHGVATLRDGESHVGFEDVDFGDYGSDELTLPLFPMEGNPFSIEIWDGMPLEGGTLLCTVTYDKGSIWNTYQEVSYRLPRRLRGVRTLCFVFRQKVHIKGFRFTKLNKAFQKLNAAENDMIYGDTFRVGPEAIEDIGNNVAIVYENMDFGDEGTVSAELCWRSPQDKNSVQLAFTDQNGAKTVQMVELDRSEAYQSKIFALDAPARGRNTVSLIFLPGCQLDLSWVRFAPGGKC